MVFAKHEPTSPLPLGLPGCPPAPASEVPRESSATPTPHPAPCVFPPQQLGSPPPLFRSVSPKIKVETSPPPLTTRERLELEERARARTPQARKRAPVPPGAPTRRRYRSVSPTALDPEQGRELLPMLRASKPRPRGRPLAASLQALKKRKD